jgi:hypothetical protein
MWSPCSWVIKSRQCLLPAGLTSSQAKRQLPDTQPTVDQQSKGNQATFDQGCIAGAPLPPRLLNLNPTKFAPASSARSALQVVGNHLTSAGHWQTIQVRPLALNTDTVVFCLRF